MKKTSSNGYWCRASTWLPVPLASSFLSFFFFLSASLAAAAAAVGGSSPRLATRR